MASSFHWTDFDVATKEFHRILKPKAIYSDMEPRFINQIHFSRNRKLFKRIKAKEKVSSGASGMTATIMVQLIASKYFEDVFYLEAIHTENINSRYIGLWKSVNDIQVQLGEENLRNF